MIVTIDGPSASGKTTAARGLAREFGFELLRTGAMYRALALAAARSGLTLESKEQELIPFLEQWRIDADGDHVWLNDEEVSGAIDGDAMSALSSALAEFSSVRKHINEAIHRRAKQYLVSGKSFVAEGRDQGSFVFPQADCKFYIDADLEVRARRRLAQMHHREDARKSLADLTEELRRRDERDSNRAVAPLCIPERARIIDSTHLDLAGVVAEMVGHIRTCRSPA